MTSFDSSTTGGYFGRAFPHSSKKVSPRRRLSKTKAASKPFATLPVDTLDEGISHRLISQKKLSREDRKFILETMGPHSQDQAVALVRSFQNKRLQHYVNLGKKGFKGIFETTNLPKNSVLTRWPNSGFLHPDFLPSLKPGIGLRDLEAQTPLMKSSCPPREIPDTQVTSTMPNHKARRVQKKLESRLSAFNQLPFPLHTKE